MAAILANMSIYMWFQIVTNALLLKYTLPPALKKSLFSNDIQLNRLYMKTGRHFEIQDGGRQGKFLAWHWPSKILIITILAMYQVSCFYHTMHNFFTYPPHYWYEYWAPTVPGDELVRFRLECSTSMYEQSTDILDQARIVMVWTRFAKRFSYDCCTVPSTV